MYIFIPILAILLMSHNTFAVSGSGVVGVGSGSIRVNGRTINGSVRDSNSLNFSQSWDSQTAYLYDGDLTSICFNTNVGISKGAYMSFTVAFSQSLGSTFSGFSGDNNIGIVNQRIETEHNTFDGTATTKVSVTYFNNGGNNSYFCLNPSNGQYIAYNDVSYNRLSIQISPVSWYYNDPYTESLQDISSKLDNQATAQDIADAVNEPEQNAANDIENQDTSDIDTGDDSSATNLIGNINTLFTQIGSIEASDNCSVPADFGNLDLGNINFCTGKDKLPFVVTFGAYAFELIFVVGTAIILVKQVLSLFDWARA